MSKVWTQRAMCTTVAAFISAAVMEPAFAQTRTTIDADTMFVVRTTEAIDVKSADGLVFTGTVEEDVLDRNGNVAVPEGSTVELLARKDGDEMTLDLESVTVNGERYAVLADTGTGWDVGTAGGRSKYHRCESGYRDIRRWGCAPWHHHRRGYWRRKRCRDWRGGRRSRGGGSANHHKREVGIFTSRIARDLPFSPSTHCWR